MADRQAQSTKSVRALPGHQGDGLSNQIQVGVVDVAKGDHASACKWRRYSPNCLGRRLDRDGPVLAILQHEPTMSEFEVQGEGTRNHQLP